MSYRDVVVYVAGQEADSEVNWRDNEDRILEYFELSTGQVWTKRNALTISWCTYFVHWVLSEAGVEPLPDVGLPKDLSGVGGSTGRFMKVRGGVYEAYPVYQKNYDPKPGDMYYRPNPYNHIGLIEFVDGREIWTIDGNSGPSFDEKYDMSYGKQIGYGFVFRPDKPKLLGGNDWYIELTPDE